MSDVLSALDVLIVVAVVSVAGEEATVGVVAVVVVVSVAGEVAAVGEGWVAGEG